MVAMEALKLLFAGNRREGKLLLLLLRWFLSDLVFPLYITRAGEADMNQQTSRIILICNQVVTCNRRHTTQEAS